MNNKPLQKFKFTKNTHSLVLKEENKFIKEERI